LQSGIVVTVMLRQLCQQPGGGSNRPNNLPRSVGVGVNNQPEGDNRPNNSNEDEDLINPAGGNRPNNSRKSEGLTGSLCRKTTIVTWNVAGLNEKRKLGAVNAMLLSSKRRSVQDAKSVWICGLQETHHESKDEKRLEFLVNSAKDLATIWSAGTSSSCGVVTLVGTHTEDTNGIKVVAKEVIIAGKATALFITTAATSMCIINVYAQPEQRETLLATVTKRIALVREHQPEYEIIVIGDLNIQSDLSMAGNSGTKPSLGQAHMDNLCLKWGLLDPVRRAGKEHFYTWRRVYTNCEPQHIKRSRLDYILLEEQRVRSVEAIASKDTALSDHCLVTVTIGADVKIKSPYWKLNPDLLQSESDEIEELFGDMMVKMAFEEEPQAIARIWESFKRNVRKAYSRLSRSEMLRKRSESSPLPAALRNEMRRDTTDVDVELVSDLIRELKEETLANAAMLSEKRRERWIKDANKPTKFFFNLAPKGKRRDVFKEFVDESGQKVTDTKAVADYAVKFYKQLYSTNDSDQAKQTEFLEQCTDELDQIAQSERDACDKAITEEEVANAIKQLEDDKTPGSDGLIIEFYKTHVSRLARPLSKLFNVILESGVMSASQKEGAIVLLYKKGDAADIRNWRPISLLNNDYKILTKVLALRLQVVFDAIVRPEQTNGAGRYIGDSVLLAEAATTNMEEGVIVFLDQEKAFDRIDQGYIIKVLEKMNFGAQFCGWIRALYKGAYSRLSLFGGLSASFPVETGVRQGDPLSPLLYVVAIEPLLRHIASSMEGIIVTDVPVKYAAYADDVALFCRDQAEANLALEKVFNFELVCNARINKDKSEFFLHQSCAVEPGCHLERLRRVFTVRYLGCQLSIAENAEALRKEFWDKLLNTIERKLSLWRRFSLDIQGRILIAKSIGMGTVVYHASMVTAPVNVLKRLQKLLDQYIWMDRRPWRNHASASLPKREGGLNYPDVHGFTDALQAKWIQRILDPSKDHQLYALLVNCIRTVVEPEGGDLCSVTYGNVRWKKAALYPWLTRMLSANDRVGWKRNEDELRVCSREKLWSLCLWKNPILSKEGGALPTSMLAVRYGYTRVGDLVTNKFTEDACRWISRADVAKWVPDRHITLVFNRLLEIMTVVQERFGGRITATARRKVNDVVILSQADEYVGSFRQEPLWKVTEVLDASQELKISPYMLADSEPTTWRKVKRFECIPVEVCDDVPIGVVERSSINSEDFVAAEYAGKAVRMSQATVKDLYRSIMTNGIWKKAREKNTEVETNWMTCVWNKHLIPKLQVFLYRLRTGSLFCGSRMRRIRDTCGADASCLRGCGELHSDTRHDLQQCPRLAQVMAKAAIAGGWPCGASPLDAVWTVGQERKKEKKDEEERIRAHMTSILYVAYLEVLEEHFEKSDREEVEKKRLWHVRILALSRDVRLYKRSSESNARSVCLDNTAEAIMSIS